MAWRVPKAHASWAHSSLAGSTQWVGPASGGCNQGVFVMKTKITRWGAVLFLVGMGLCFDPTLAAVHSASAPSNQVLESVVTSITSVEGRIVSVGERGIILFSDDNGKSWSQGRTPSRITLTRIEFSSQMTGWAVGHGGVVWKTEDAGATWTQVLDGLAAAKLEYESAASALAAAPGAEASRRLKDAERLVQDGADKPLLGLHFFDDSHGIVFGAYGLALETRDGGGHWTSMMGRIDNPTGRHLYDFAELDGVMILVGEQGAIFKATGSDLAFRSIPSGSRATFFGAATTGSGAIVSYGLRGALYVSHDKAETWSRLSMPQATLTGGTRLRDGSVLLVDEIGHFYQYPDKDGGIRNLNLSSEIPAQCLTEASNGSLVVAGIRGSFTLSTRSNAQEPGK